MPHTFHTEQTELQTCNAKLNGGDRKSYIASPRNLLLPRHQTAEKSNHAFDKNPETDRYIDHNLYGWTVPNTGVTALAQPVTSLESLAGLSRDPPSE